VQRHRDQRIGLGQNLAAGVADPAPHHRRQIEPVAIFEGMDQGARNLVEAHRGARAVVGGRVGNRFHRQHARPRIVLERDAEPLAVRPRDQRQFRPASRTKATALDRLAAGGAQPRQCHVDRGAAKRLRRGRDTAHVMRNNEARRHRHGANDDDAFCLIDYTKWL
jgi:hypothetical protein